MAAGGVRHGGGWPLAGRGVLEGLLASAGLCVPGERGGPCRVLSFQMCLALCFCFAYIVFILTGSLQIRKLRLRAVKSFTQGPPSR